MYHRAGPAFAPMVWLTVLAAALIYSLTLTYPFNNDNALYAYMGDLMLHGKLPYLGSWDQNFPAIVGIHALQILMSGHSQLAFHIFDVLLQLCGVMLLIRIGTKLHSRNAGLLAALLAALYYVQQGLWMAGERDTYATILLLLAIDLDTNTRRRPMLVGVVCGLIVLFRPTYALFTPVFVVYEYFRLKNSREPMLLGAAAAIPILIVILIYAACGGLRDLYEACILFNLKIYSGAGISFSLWEPVRFYLVAAMAAIVGLVSLWKSRRLDAGLLAAVLVAGLISIVVLYRHSVYHYHPAMTMLILLSAIGWIVIAEYFCERFRVPMYAVPCLVLLFFMLQTFRGNTIQLVLRDILNGKIHSLPEAYTYYENSPEFGVNIQQRVGEYLQGHTKPGDTVQMFGPYSYPQYFAQVTTASRFQTLHAITMRGASGELQPFQVAWRNEYLRDMQQKHPIYFIVCDAPEAFRQYYGGRLGHEILAHDFAELGAFIQKQYSPETKIGAFTLYRRNS